VRSAVRWPRRVAAVLAVGCLAAAAACGSAGAGSTAAGGSAVLAKASADTGAATLRLGYFPNVTHASAIVGVQKGFFADHLGKQVALTTTTYNAGPDELQALLSGGLDIAYIGPSPAINGYTKSQGQGLKVIGGATSGGAGLVVKPGITVTGLKGKKIASPQLGNTQDVALRYFLKEHGYTTDQQGGGDVSVVPQDNATALQSFLQGSIDGAWVPEPYASRLVAAGGQEIVDERSLWPGNAFVSTLIVVRTAYLAEHPGVVERFLAGQAEANSYLADAPADAQQVVNDGLAKLGGKKLDAPVLTSAFQHLNFTNDPLAGTLAAQADHAVAVGLVAKPNLTGIVDLTLLNAVLRTAGQPTVAPAAGS
jgi:NitT/TauT family transport system substrate-binding protein